ncbi:MAG: transcription termination/antitermination protein NusA [Anaerolineae bacterium]|nr:transcription termination/antitermination protein NusA [Anaerolineae bacterium]
MKSDFLLAFNEIAEVRKLSRETIMEALKAALVSAYRRNAGIGTGQHVEARIDEKNGTLDVWVEKEVVETVESELTEVPLEIARTVEPEAELGDMVMVESTPQDFGRIAAQTAKQVILQRMREAERDAQYQEYLERIGDLITGTVQSDSGGMVTLGLGRTEAILPHSQQMPNERYRVHDKVRAYVMEVRKTNRGPQIVVSRTHRNMLRRLLEYEVPEIYNGTVEIKSIAREPGARSKVAVAALQEGADPVGACVGMRGVRIQGIVKELNNEKIDVIEWNPDPKTFIAKALSPARVSSVFLDDDPDEGRTGIVVVPDDQLSLAIGREGQNARLAAKLTGWRIDIKSVMEAAQETLTRLDEPEIADVVKKHTALIEQSYAIMEKRETNRPITPEDYEVLVRLVDLIETHRLEIREANRAERRAFQEAARAQVPVLAYEHPLEDTDLPQRIYNILSEAGYSTVGQTLEQYYLNTDVLMNLSGIGETSLEAIEAALTSIEFPEPELEEPVAEEAEEELVTEAEIESAASEEEIPTAQAEAVEELPTEKEAAVSDRSEEEELARAQRAALVAQLSDMADMPSEAVLSEMVEMEEDISPAAEEKIYETYEDEDEPGEYEGMSAEEEEQARREKAKKRRRQLVYDEELGQVVAKRRRKPSRRREKWEGFVIEDDEE